MQSVLTTERLILRPREAGDLDACYAMNMEPGTVDYVDFPREGSWDNEATHKAYIAETLEYAYPDGLGYWTVVPRDAPTTFLGWVLMAPEDLVGSEIEVGWRFVTAARGKGYGAEAAQAMLAHGFGTLGLSGVVADIYKTNAASTALARKLGMRLRDDPERVTETYVLWELTREMWAART